MGYTPSDSGLTCWYELSTTDVGAADTFYSEVLGWNVAETGMPGMDYRLGMVGDAAVAGLTQVQGDSAPAWIFYVEVADCDASAAKVADLGGTVLAGPADIPGTGRFAVCRDPQGAVFGMLRPNEMETDLEASAFDQDKPGHGNWHELNTTDIEAAFDFYAGVFGWTRGENMDMGADGHYQIVNAGKVSTGGIMSISKELEEHGPGWAPFFGVEGVQAGLERATGAGATLLHGPSEVPGGGHIAYFRDPQGATFAIVGPL